MIQTGLQLLAKKALDRTVALAALTVVAPVLAVSALAVRVTMGGPVLFSQTRPGHRGKLFRIYKMRTMTDARDESGNLKPDEERLTQLGRFLRATSVDEFPQVYNVLRGEMSLVGPRPLLPEYLPLYSREQARRHDVLPGITGWTQVRGRNAQTWDDKFALDLWYVDHWSLRLDLRILMETVVKVVRREGISHPGHATMPVFDHNPIHANGFASKRPNNLSD